MSVSLLEFPDYEISSGGRITSLRGTLRGKRRRLALSRARHGYLHVTLYSPIRKQSFQVGHLVLLAFHGPPPPGHECRHLDGDPTNNTLENLAWGTPVQNAHDRVIHGTATNKLSPRQVILARSSSGTCRQIAKYFGVSEPAIHNLINGLTYRWVSNDMIHVPVSEIAQVNKEILAIKIDMPSPKRELLGRRLTLHEKEQIRILRSLGARVKDLATQFKVTERTISRVTRSK